MSNQIRCCVCGANEEHDDANDCIPYFRATLAESERKREEAESNIKMYKGLLEAEQEDCQRQRENKNKQWERATQSEAELVACREALKGMIHIFDRGLSESSIGRRYCDEAKAVLSSPSAVTRVEAVIEVAKKLESKISSGRATMDAEEELCHTVRALRCEP